MKVDELRVLEVDELGGRLKAARRELYELRFKHAVGQLENSSQIMKVRKDIARIMTVLRERDFGIVAQVAPDTSPGLPATRGGPREAGGGETPQPTAAMDEGFEPLEEAPVAVADEPKPKRGRRAKTEEAS